LLLEDVNNREEPVQEEPLAAYQAHSEVQFMSLREQIEALTKLMSNGSGRNRHRHIPSPHKSEEEDAQVENEDGNPFAECRVHGHQPLSTSSCQLVGIRFQTRYSRIQRGSLTRGILGLDSGS
jgi:hypothetical protein